MFITQTLIGSKIPPLRASSRGRLSQNLARRIATPGSAQAHAQAIKPGMLVMLPLRYRRTDEEGEPLDDSEPIEV
jgi:hypothetical protein